MQTYNVIACGLDISFNSTADAERVRRATEFIQQSYDSLQFHGSQLGRDRLLAIIAIGIADDLLQLQKEHEKLLEKVGEEKQKEDAVESRIEDLLDMINTHISEAKNS